MYFRPGLEHGGRHHSQRSPYRSVGRWGDGGGVRRWRRQPRRGRRQRRRRRRRRQFAQAAGASSGYGCWQGGRGQRFPRARVPGLGGWGKTGRYASGEGGGSGGCGGGGGRPQARTSPAQLGCGLGGGSRSRAQATGLRGLMARALTHSVRGVCLCGCTGVRAGPWARGGGGAVPPKVYSE